MQLKNDNNNIFVMAMLFQFFKYLTMTEMGC